MADYFSATGDLIGGFTDLIAGNAGAAGAKAAAASYTKAAQITEQATNLKALQQVRSFYQVQSSAQAAAGASGLTTGGSAADILRSNAQQGSMAKAMIEQQGRIQEQAYIGQAGEATQEAAASKAKGKGGLFGGIVGAVGAMIS